jgi:hypothetical protein
MAVLQNLLNGVMNKEAVFEEVCKVIVEAINNNLDKEVSFGDSTIREGHKVLVLGGGTMKGDICTDYLYIYDDGEIYPNQVDDGVS